MRFRTKKGWILEIADDGTILIGINIDNGNLFDAEILSENKLENFEVHPDTNGNL